MRTIVKTGIALSALLAFAAIAQQTPQAPQPTQIPSAAAGQTGAGTPVGGSSVTLPGVGAVSATSVAVGAAIAVGITAVAVSSARNTDVPSAPSGTK
jgi:hypothetical protein